MISEVRGHLIRDDSEIYPIAGGWYYEPASGLTTRFARNASGRVDSSVTRYPGRPTERVLPRIGPR